MRCRAQKKGPGLRGAISGPEAEGNRLVLGEAEVLEPRFVTVFGEHDPSFAGGEALLVLELALGDALFPFGGGGVGFAGEFSVEPVFDFAGFDDDLAVVPFTDGLERLVSRGFFDVVDGCSGVGTAAESVGMAAVIDHLVLDAQPLFPTDLGDPELDAVVAFGTELPIPFELEVGVLVFGDQRACTFAGKMDDPVGFCGPA